MGQNRAHLVPWKLEMRLWLSIECGDNIASILRLQKVRICRLLSLRSMPGKQLIPRRPPSALHLRISRHQSAGASDSEMMTQRDEHGYQHIVMGSAIKS